MFLNSWMVYFKCIIAQTCHILSRRSRRANCCNKVESGKSRATGVSYCWDSQVRWVGCAGGFVNGHAHQPAKRPLLPAFNGNL